MGAVRVLVTGASGLLGRAVVKECQKRSEWTVQGWGFSRVEENGVMVRVDLRDSTATRKAILDFQPNIIIHTAAERKPDVVESQSDAVLPLNVEGPRTLATAAKELCAFIVYVSTDYVFDGTSPPYKPEDKANPLNSYGKSKLAGESATLEANSDACVLRLPILYGGEKRIDESAVSLLAAAMMKGSETVPMDATMLRHPTYVDDAAAILCQMAEKKVPGGIYHWAAKNCMTKFDMAMAISKSLGLGADNLVKDDSLSSSTATTRPIDPALDRSKLETLGITVVDSNFEIAIGESLRSFVKNPSD